MKLLKLYVLLVLVSGAVSQSFFAFRQPKNKNPDEVTTVEENKRSKVGHQTDGGLEGDEVAVDLPSDPEHTKRNFDAPGSFFDIQVLLDDVMKGFGETPNTWKDEEMVPLGGKSNTRGMREYF